MPCRLASRSMCRFWLGGSQRQMLHTTIADWAACERRALLRLFLAIPGFSPRWS
jgi:hypothetical protein